MMDSGQNKLHMVKGFNKHLKVDTKEIFLKVKNQEKVNLLGQMVRNMMDYLKMET